MIGSGRASIAEICDIARANCMDGMSNTAIEILASLGANGAHASNQERDLHCWLASFVSVKPWPCEMLLNAASFARCYLIAIFFDLQKCLWKSLRCQASSKRRRQRYGSCYRTR